MRTLLAGLVLAISIAPAVALASPGRTDAKGCHTESKTGNYHCHSKPAVKTEAKVVTKTVAKTAAKSGFVDKNCPDFATHAQAQAFFIANGGPSSDPHRLDADKDGLACETLK
ncbi:MAG: beta-lactamase domain protein [Candidatus Adlerbacteria bacterium]|nr:beta-lactamase domain protein [Candidatus Adlerbacteria bacterium]